MYNSGSSNAKKIEEESCVREKQITMTACRHAADMRKQKLCGLILIVSAIAANLFAQDVELFYALIPVGIYIIFTKKSIFTF